MNVHDGLIDGGVYTRRQTGGYIRVGGVIISGYSTNSILTSGYSTNLALTRLVGYQLIYDESEWNNCFIIYTQALDKKQHNHELKGDYLKLILHSRHVFLQYDLSFCLEDV